MVIFHDNHKDENRAEKCNINSFVFLLYALYATPSRPLDYFEVFKVDDGDRPLCSLPSRGTKSAVLENKPRTSQRH